MGYESRLYIVETHKDSNYAGKIATIDMGNMGGNGWRELFNKPFEYEMYADDRNTLLTKDKYGEKLTYAEIDPVIEWLETKGKEMDYRRITLLLGLLKAFDRSKWGELKIVHFRY